MGDQQCIGPPNFLALVFKKQEISQQVVTRMQDLASEFTKTFWGWYPRTLTAGGATPSRTQHPARRGVQAPWCWDPNLGPLQLFSRHCAPDRMLCILSVSLHLFLINCWPCCTVPCI